MTNTTDPIGKVKEIKDYLHLYFGCECMMTKNSYHAVHELHLSADSSFKLTGRLLHYFTEPSTTAECKPILRPLSDMTEEEAIEVAGLSEWEGHFRDVKVERNKFNDLIVSWDGITEGGETFNSTGELFYCSDQFIYLLSKQFDLFELIEYGLAIDKTKLTAHA